MAHCIVDHFSYSQLSTYLTCPLRYKLHYVDLIAPAFTASSLVFGHAIHEAVGAFHQQHLLGDTLSPDEMVDVYRQAWASRDGGEVRFFNGDNESTLTEKASQILSVFHNSFDPTVQILGIEEFFEVQLAREVPPFRGYIDVIEQRTDGTITVADLKTCSKKPSAAQVHGNLQLTGYSLGAQALGFDPEQLALRLDVLTKTKNPEMVRLETSRTKADRERFVKLVKHVWLSIEGNAFFPREDWQCSQCAWAEHCKEW